MADTGIQEREAAGVEELHRSIAAAAEMEPGHRVSMLVGLQKASFNLIRHADSKAQMLLRIALALAGVAFIGVPPTVAAMTKVIAQGEMESWKLTLFIAVIALYLFCTICLLVAVVRILRVIRPRMTPLGMRPSVFFHQSIVGMGYENFRAEMRGIDYDRAIDELTNDLYQMAYITAAKYKSLNEAIGWMMGGGLFGVFFAVILMVSIGFFGDGAATSAIP